METQTQQPITAFTVISNDKVKSTFASQRQEWWLNVEYAEFIDFKTYQAMLKRARA